MDVFRRQEAVRLFPMLNLSSKSGMMSWYMFTLQVTSRQSIQLVRTDTPPYWVLGTRDLCLSPSNRPGFLYTHVLIKRESKGD